MADCQELNSELDKYRDKEVDTKMAAAKGSYFWPPGETLKV